jgi:hypothetical protein
MRFNFRIKLGNITLFFMLSKTQTLNGITSKVGKDKHIIMWDLENCTLKQAIKALRVVQEFYKLSNIYIFSDHEKSFRAICYNIVSFRKFMQILFDTDYVDFSFIHWTITRAKATLRTGDKQGRTAQKLVKILRSYTLPFPEKIELCQYDTGVQKSGFNILLGDN